MFAAALALLLTAATVTAGVDDIDPAIAAATVRLQLQGDTKLNCTGVLIAADVVATAAHCIKDKPASALHVFVADEPMRTALDVIARGAVHAGKSAAAGSYGTDWLLIRIAPTTVPPLPIATLSSDMIAADANTAADVTIASWAGKRLHLLPECGLFPNEFAGFFAMTCEVDNGDSGGPVILATPNGPRVIGVLSGWNKAASYAASASEWAHLVH